MRLFWLHSSPKLTSCPSLNVSQAEWGFAVDTIWWVVLTSEFRLLRVLAV